MQTSLFITSFRTTYAAPSDLARLSRRERRRRARAEKTLN